VATAIFQQGADGYSGTGWFGMVAAQANSVWRTNGTNHYWWAGRFEESPSPSVYRGGLKFDVSSITGPVIVSSATLTLTFVAESVTTDYAVYAYKSLKAWNTPAGDADPAGANKPCWTYQYYNGTAWSTAGAGGEDSDRDTDVLASATVTSAAPTAIDLTGASFTSLVEGWINGTVTNNGLFICGQEDGADRTKGWALPTHGTTSYRPKLTVIYTGAAAGPSIPILMGSFRHRWS